MTARDTLRSRFDKAVDIYNEWQQSGGGKLKRGGPAATTNTAQVHKVALVENPQSADDDDNYIQNLI